MENRKKEIAKFYEQIFLDAKLKERIVEKARKIVNEEDFRTLIREEIIPLMKKFKVNFSEEELLEDEEENLKKLSKEALADASGGASFKPLAIGALSALALTFGVGVTSFATKDPPTGKTPNQGQQQGQGQKQQKNKPKPTKVKIKEKKHTQTYGDDDDDVPQISVEKFLAYDEGSLKLSLINEFIEANPADKLIKEHPEAAEEVCKRIEQYQKKKKRTNEKWSSYCNEIRSKLEKLKQDNNNNYQDDDDDEPDISTVDELLNSKNLTVPQVINFIEKNPTENLKIDKEKAKKLYKKLNAFYDKNFKNKKGTEYTRTVMKYINGLNSLIKSDDNIIQEKIKETASSGERTTKVKFELEEKHKQSDIVPLVVPAEICYIMWLQVI